MARRGRLKFAHDLDDSALDRTDAYDVAGRISSGYAGSYLPNSNVTSGPYQEGFSYDVWGNLSGRTWRQYETVWTPGGTVRYPATRSYSETFVNNRSTNAGWSYDADGRALTSTSAVNSSYTQTNSYDAAGQMISTSVPSTNYSFAYDGNGQRVKYVENGDITYYVTSTVLGQIVAELNPFGAKKRSYVYAGGQVLAKQEGNQVLWDNRDSTGRSARLTSSNATVTSRVELDPLSVAVDPTNVPQGNSPYTISPVGFYGSPTEPNLGCRADNVPTSCNLVQASLRAGGSIECLGGPCPTAGWNPNRDGPGQGGFFLYRYDAFGNQFGVPIGGSTSPQNAGIKFQHPQNPAPTPRPEVDKLYGWWGPCNRSANDLMRTVRRDFSKFGNFAESVAGGTAVAGIHFDSGPITQGRVIGITVGAVSTVDPSLSYSQHVSVTVNPASTMGFTFVTNPGHFFYPGTISFSARDVTSNGASAVDFQIKAQGQLADFLARRTFEFGGGDFEDDAWKNFLAKIRKSCGHSQ